MYRIKHTKPQLANSKYMDLVTWIPGNFLNMYAFFVLTTCLIGRWRYQRSWTQNLHAILFWVLLGVSRTEIEQIFYSMSRLKGLGCEGVSKTYKVLNVKLQLYRQSTYLYILSVCNTSESCFFAKFWNKHVCTHKCKWQRYTSTDLKFFKKKGKKKWKMKNS